MLGWWAGIGIGAAAALSVAEAAEVVAVSGRLLDAHGRAVPEATVQVVETGAEATTDMDGRFSLALPAGSYTFRMFGADTGVATVKAEVSGRSVVVDAVLPEVAGEEIEVIGRADMARDAALLAERKGAAGVSDSVGAESIKRGTDKSAADVVKRVPGVSVVGDRYVYVRGMGERYNTTVLNGQTIPSPEPRKRVVPFNLLPASLIENIVVIKTPTADMDGDTVGGRVEVTTKDYPEAPTASLTLGGGYTPGVTGLPRLTDPSSDRAAPSAPAPTFEELLQLSDEELSSYAKKWDKEWSPGEATALPSQSASLTLGGTKRLGGQKLGGVLALSYDASDRSLDEDVTFHTRETADDGSYTYVPSSTLTQQTDTHSQLLGGLATVAWQVRPTQEVKLRTVYTRRTDEEVRQYSQENDSGELFNGTRIRYGEQEIWSSVLQGKHQWDLLGREDVTLKWNVNYATASLDEPDRREFIYSTANSTAPSDGSAIPLTWFDQSGFRVYQSLSDQERGGGVDLRVPMWDAHDGAVQVGGKLRDKARDFSVDTYKFDVSSSLSDEERSRPPEELLAGEGVTVSDTTRPQDSYDGLMRVWAGYGMVDAWVTPRVRGVVGARVESTYQDFQTGEYLDEETTPEAYVVQQYTDILPSMLWTFSLTGRDNPQPQNLRFAVFKSIARPDYFEIVPFRFTNYYKNSTQTGNPDLDRTQIWSADLRWEIFPQPDSVLSAGAFFKQLTNPIETVYVNDPEQGQINLEKPYNIPTGQVVGGELEARQTLGWLSPAMEAVFYGANVTLVWSEVRFPEETLDGGEVELNELERPLAGQSPYLANLSLGYQHKGFSTQASWNLTGPRLVTVGANGLPSTYEEAWSVVDLALTQAIGEHLSVSLKGRNLGDPARRYTQEGKTSYTTHLGQTYSLSLTGSL